MAIKNRENIKNKYSLFSANAGNVGIKFLQGTQLALNALISSQDAVEGAFYLTSDTSRLYVGRKLASDSSKIVPVPVNEGVTTVEDVDHLPNTANIGDFYYAEDENILCVCAKVEGTSDSDRTCTWVQLNTNTTNTSLTHTLTSVSGNSNAVNIGTSVTDSAGHSVNDSWKLLGSSNLTVAYDNSAKTITLTSADTTYTLGVSSEDDAQNHYLTLSDGTTTQKVKLIGNRVDVDTATAGQVTITGQLINGASETHDSGTGWKVGVNVNNNLANDRATIDPIIHYGSGASGTYTTEAKFALGTADLDVYTTSETDSAIATAINVAKQAFNAMQFKGVISTADGVPALSNCSAGDTYKMGRNGPFTGVNILNIKTGDLLIATGTEDASGKLTGNDATWELVPSGDEPVYVGELITHGVRLLAGGANGTVEAGIELIEGNMITLSDANTGKLRRVTVSHASIAKGNGVDTKDTTGAVQSSTFASASATNALEFYVLAGNGDTDDGIVRDAYGHITAVHTKKITVKDTHNYITIHSTSATVDSNHNVATITHYLGNKDTAVSSPSSQMQITSNNLTLGASTSGTAGTAGAIGQVTIDFNWGTF